MDESRAQAYLHLIQQLLDCPNSERPQILQANSELLDGDFLQTCEQVATMLAEQGQENQALFLRNLASQLGKLLGMRENDNSDAGAPTDRLDFLMQLLQTVRNSQGNPQQVYPFLQQNLDQLDLQLAEILTAWATDTFAKVEATQVYNIAVVIGNLANRILAFPLGSRWVNLEIAIACYEIASTVFNRASFPQEWTTTQNNLGLAYSDRIRGARADNLEMAIAYYNHTLEVRTRNAFPQDWAGTQNNLANAYSDRIRGERADNLEEAIACYHRALEVYTREAFPEKWAMTQNNLGLAYSDRIRGERADNLEQAIACSHRALEVRTHDAFPEKWAMTQNNLGLAYSNRIRGERADNLEQAIACYHRALEVYTREAFPEKWATTQHNLGEAYRNRIRGERADNLEQAIACNQKALEVRTHDAFPEQWAMTQHNLANAYSDRIRGERADNLEQAIACSHRALEVRTRDAFPEQWAMTQNNLANAYCDRIRGDRANNLEQAIACYHRALEVRTRETFPEDWAETQNNLGLAYYSRIRGERADNLEQAIKSYRQALEIWTTSAFPLNCLIAGRNLGNLAFELQDWETAIDGYENAISAVEQSRDWAGTEAAKQEIQENAIEVYFQMLQACINAKNLPKAVETVERSKARNLVELLATRDLYPKGNIPQEILDQLDDLRRKIPAMQRQLGQKTPNQLSSQADDTEKQLRRELTALQQQLDSVLAEIKKVDPDFNLTQRVEVIPYSEIQSLAANNTAIIEWYIAKDKFLAFVISPNSPTPIVWQSSTADFNNLENWRNEYLADYRQNNSQWQQNLTDNLQHLAAILHLDELLNLIPPTCHQLVLIPHSYLHLFPLHALPSKRQKINPENSQLDTATGCLLDLFPKGVSYAPSCQLLQLAKKRPRPNFSRLFAIANPTKDRYLLELQAANIRQGFQSDSFWQRDNANKQAIINQQLNLANCAHFGCHGKFKPDAPLESYLELANNDRLTLLEILALDLSQCRLVTLSACETGLTESSTTDEYIGLPFGFLLAGSPSMVSSLWKVDQLASTLLLMRFYENLKTLSTVTALNEAQQWLRNLTSEQLQALLKHLQPQIDQISNQLPQKERTRFVNAPLKGALNRQPFPFAAPHYWAAFTAIGV